MVRPAYWLRRRRGRGVLCRKKGKIASGRDITTALIGLDSPDVLVVGGLFGALGYLLTWLFNFVPQIGGSPWTNTIALSIVVNAIVVRLVFGKTGIFGQVRRGDNRWVPSDVASWLPWQSRPLQLIVLAIGVGLPSAYLAKALPNSVGLGFGIVAASLIFLQYGTKVPVSHHIALSAEVVTAATGNLWWGLALALLAAFLGEFYACLFTAHGDTHIDPPSCALATTGLVIPLLSVSGALTISGLAPAAIAAAVALVGYVLASSLRFVRLTPASASKV